MSALVQVPPGTLLLFFTDGIVETTRDVLAGLAALRSALACSEIAEAEYPAVALRDALLPAGAHDDVAMLSITIRDAGVPHWRFASDDAKAAQWVKRSFVGALIGAGVAQEDAALAEIVLGELVGNVARHAPGEVEVYLDLSRRNPVLHVLDRGPGFVYTAMLQPTDVFAESGRGLYIASRLARGLSVTRRPGGGSHARAVLAAVARAAEEPPALRAPSVRRAAGTTLG
jgi:anti-sigma regulatory factor (Ser/Thr protein kinase)